MDQGRRLLGAAILALCLAGTGCASAQTAADPAPSGLCTAEQRAVIREAFDEAERRTLQAIGFLDTNPWHPHVARWFGTAPRKAVRQRLSRVADALRAGQRPGVSCDDSVPACRSAFALINRMTREMTVCSTFFRSKSEGRDSRFGTLIHEVSHLVAGTLDIAYGPRRCEALARERPLDAMRNADSYEYFVEMLPS